MKIVAINNPDPRHLTDVVAAMRKLGAPTIKAVWMECWDRWVALEGSHRLAAARTLGLEPQIEEIEYNDTATLADLGCDDSGEGCTVTDICDSAWDPRRPVYTF